MVWNKRKEREEFVLCEDFSGTPSCLSLHCFDCFCTVYTRVSVSAWQTVRLCGMYVCVCMYRHSISDLSTPLAQLSLGEGMPPKNTVLFTIGGLFEF